MNRLWVRISLVIIGVSLLIVASTFAVEFVGRFFNPSDEPTLNDEVNEVIAALPPETVQRFEERGRRNAIQVVTTLIISASVIGGVRWHLA